MKTVLRITKYLLIIFIILLIIIITSFIVYSRKLNYIIPNSMSIEIYDIKNTKYLSLNNENRKNYIRLIDISDNIVNAFISIEDKNFYKHKGINFTRIIGALYSNITKGKIVEGASTITQQYARNLFLNNEKKLKRKLNEAMIAINLESKYSKDEILEGYLNTIYFDHGIYGIEDACRFYFNKSASNVTINEAAILASIPKGPSYYSPIKNPENNNERKLLVLQEMLDDNKITEKELEQATLEKTTFYGKLDTIKDNNAPYFQDIIIKELNKLNIPDSILKKGVKIYTSLDLSLNDIINKAIKKYYPINENNLQIAIYAMNPKTGEVLSVIGGKNYEESIYNRATTALRQPGSTIKSFLYYSALDNGFTVATTFKSEETSFYTDDGLYSPNNIYSIYPNRDVSMLYAIATSDNIYAIKTHLFLGSSNLVKTLKNFGFTNDIKNNTSLALGTSEVTLKELVTAYSKIASLGKDVTPTYINKIVDYNGNTIYQGKKVFEQRFDESTCYILSEALTNIFDTRLAININTTGSSISSKISKKYAAKSGSTDFDNWIVGYDSNIVLGIWTGYDDNSKTNNSITKYIKNIWAEIMENYCKINRFTNLNSWYEQPQNTISIDLNPITGKFAKGNEYKKALYFKKNCLPYNIKNAIK